MHRSSPGLMDSNPPHLLFSSFPHSFSLAVLPAFVVTLSSLSIAVQPLTPHSSSSCLFSLSTPVANLLPSLQLFFLCSPPVSFSLSLSLSLPLPSFLSHLPLLSWNHNRHTSMGQYIRHFFCQNIFLLCP